MNRLLSYVNNISMGLVSSLVLQHCTPLENSRDENLHQQKVSEDIELMMAKYENIKLEREEISQQYASKGNYVMLQDYYNKSKEDNKVALEDFDISTITETAMRSESKISKDILLSTFDTVNIEGVRYFVVEGDILLDDDEFLTYYYSIPYRKDSSLFESAKLIGISINGVLAKIPNAAGLRFAIIKKSFNDSEYEEVVNNFNQAAFEWSQMCNVRFKHLFKLDDKLEITDNPDSLDFVIRKINVFGSFEAEAFFPFYPKHRRKVFIDQSYFSSEYDSVGIFRHEIGHILGFRHEHTRNPVCNEKQAFAFGDTFNVTNYDPKSVMHYYCNGVGNKKLAFTKQDSIGAIEYYPF